MHTKSTGPTMNQKIFTMDLDVETVSLYLLCCAVADAGAPITERTLQEKWNGSPETLAMHLGYLEDKSILTRDTDKGTGETTYLVVDEKKWG